MMFDHRPYPKIGCLAEAPIRDVEWVATEKIHGANMVVATDGRQTRFGKRKAWLADDEPFFGWQMLRHELAGSVIAAHRHIGHEGLVRFYGELFGGGYPHPQVSSFAGLSPVQTGVWYSPALQFAVFDVLIEPEGGCPRFLRHDEVLHLAQAVGLRAVPELARGRQEELTVLPARFLTRVPAQLGLPELEDNFAEGWVAKPVNGGPPSARPAIKRKIEEFSELRFDQSRPFNPDVFLNVDELAELGALLMNPARIASARSKVGTDPDRVVEEAVLDAWVDLETVFPRRLKTLTDIEEQRLQTTLIQRAQAIESQVRSKAP